MKVTEYEETQNYIKIRLDATSDERWEVDKWCLKTQCGKKINYRSFAFKTDAEYMMFKLKWL